jgi:hypothetical protein
LRLLLDLPIGDGDNHLWIVLGQNDLEPTTARGSTENNTSIWTVAGVIGGLGVAESFVHFAYLDPPGFHLESGMAGEPHLRIG